MYFAAFIYLPEELCASTAKLCRESNKSKNTTITYKIHMQGLFLAFEFGVAHIKLLQFFQSLQYCPDVGENF